MPAGCLSQLELYKSVTTAAAGFGDGGGPSRFEAILPPNYMLRGNLVALD